MAQLDPQRGNLRRQNRGVNAVDGDIDYFSLRIDRRSGERVRRNSNLALVKVTLQKIYEWISITAVGILPIRYAPEVLKILQTPHLR